MPPKKRKPLDVLKDSRADTRSELEKKWRKEEVDALCKKFTKGWKEKTDCETSCGIDDTYNPLTSGVEEDINLAHSSGSGSSTSCASRPITTQQSNSMKETKNINLPNASSEKPSFLCTTKHREDENNDINKKTMETKTSLKEKLQPETKRPIIKHTKGNSESKKLDSNTDEARQSCSQSVPINYSDDKSSHMCKQRKMQVKAEIEATAKVEALKSIESRESVSSTLKNVSPLVHRQTTEGLIKEPENPEQKLKTYKKIREYWIKKEKSRKPGSNTDEARQSSLQSIPINSSDDKNSQMCKQRTMQVKAEINATEKLETLKPNKGREFVSSTLKNVSPIVHSQTTEDFTKESEKLEENLNKYEMEVKILIEQVKKLSLSGIGTKMAISGNIEVRAIDESARNSDKENSLSCEYKQEFETIYIQDRNIKITIQVAKGNQVVCKSRIRPSTDLVDVTSSSETLEGQTTEKPDCTKTNSENNHNTTGNTRCDSNSVSEFSKRNFQTEDDQATVVTGTTALMDYQQHDETANDTNRRASSINEYPKENDFSILTSAEKNIQQVNADYLKDIKSACTKYNRNMENYIRGDSFKSSGD